MMAEVKIGCFSANRFLSLMDPPASPEPQEILSADALNYILSLQNEPSKKNFLLFDYFKIHAKDCSDKEVVRKIAKAFAERICSRNSEDDFVELKRECKAPTPPPAFSESYYLYFSTLFFSTNNTLKKWVQYYCQSGDPVAKLRERNPDIREEFIGPIRNLMTPSKCLSNGDVQQLLDFMLEHYPNTFDMILEGISEDINENRYPAPQVKMRLKEYQKDQLLYRKQRYLFIPFVYSGYVHHIVCIAVDFSLKKVFYFDSKGAPSGPVMRPQLEEINTMCFGDEGKIQESNAIHQHEFFNCGVYVVHFIELLLKGKTFEEIQSEFISFAEIEQVRELLAFRLSGS